MAILNNKPVYVFNPNLTTLTIQGWYKWDEKSNGLVSILILKFCWYRFYEKLIKLVKQAIRDVYEDYI